MRRRFAIVSALERAARCMDDDPDSAAVLADGLIQRLATEWFVAHRRPVPLAEALLPALEAEAQPVAWRMRLALRAPHARARLVHCWDLLRAVFDDDVLNFGAEAAQGRS
jgi:hypothetical protein